MAYIVIFPQCRTRLEILCSWKMSLTKKLRHEGYTWTEGTSVSGQCNRRWREDWTAGEFLWKESRRGPKPRASARKPAVDPRTILRVCLAPGEFTTLLSNLSLSRLFSMTSLLLSRAEGATRPSDEDQNAFIIYRPLPNSRTLSRYLLHDENISYLQLKSSSISYCCNILVFCHSDTFEI